MGYRYFDSFGVKPWYPFGFGLSYTDFSITVKDISVKGENVSVQAAVKNTGKSYSGKEVVQVYVCPPKGRLDKAFQELKAFEKTRELVPGEAQELSLTIPLKELASYDEKAAAWILEPGEYVIRVGNSSADTRAAAALLIREEIRTEILRNLLPADGEWEEIHPAVKAGEKRNTEPHLTVIPVNASEIPSKTVNDPPARKTEQREAETQYRLEDIIHGRCTPEQVAEQLTVEELAALCVGTTRMENGSSIVGGASASVPGAAGDTSPVAEERYGIRSLVLADGPAGLRLLPHFKTDKEGKVLPGGVVFGGLVTPFETDGVEEVQDYYQYCTAIPTGWALAQSWNRELAECAGKMIGEEMEQFGVDLWLAPALNIHRNPLCGRNFEYFSEDPLISGEMAAALTKGVQSCPGKGVTIKHFAANNQEDNRYFLNAHIHERALREIYLKGFEIAVKKAKPFALMTSYNLINGIHTANSYDLLWGILRQEWGFDGLVMTDWFTSQDVPAMTGKFEQKYPISSSVGCIYAGNSVQMPGCEENVRDIVTAARTRANIDGFRITHEDLIRCAADVIRTVGAVYGTR